MIEDDYMRVGKGDGSILCLFLITDNCTMAVFCLTHFMVS